MKHRVVVAAHWCFTCASCALLVLTLLRQHPNRSVALLPHVRGLQPFMDELVPDWRFFAPRPMTTDVLLFVRSLDAFETPSEWVALTSYPERKLRQLIFFPDRRRSKALLDVTNLFLQQLEQFPDDFSQRSMYRLLAEHVRMKVQMIEPAAIGFQFCIVRNNGYEGGDITIPFTSGYIPLAAQSGELKIREEEEAK